MPALCLSDGASQVLEQNYHTNTDLGKWRLYSIINTTDETMTELCDAALKSYNDEVLHIPEEELQDLIFIETAHENRHCPGKDVQFIFDAHIKSLKTILEQDDNGEPANDHQIYPFGFVAMTKPDWRESGLTVVHCDKDRGKWKVRRCTVPFKDFGLPLTSLAMGDEYFDEVIEQYRHMRDSNEDQDDGPDNQGGAVPYGEWQFAVFGSAVPPALSSATALGDPRADSFPIEELSLDMIGAGNMTGEQLLEKFPVDVARANNPILPNGRTRPLQRHPSLFIDIDKSLPDEDGVLIVKMDWDEDVSRSEDPLREAGRNSHVETRQCEAKLALSTIRAMANEGK
ncbi:hypothetical protein AAFC00_004977 [Neodothiora populina]|uniref:Mating type protein n=1 Tax=Neodothiora populina TaxID=2781224 RepID=A0ABR3P489_9PEZI